LIDDEYRFIADQPWRDFLKPSDEFIKATGESKRVESDAALTGASI
jgi:hypothetical protein